MRYPNFHSFALNQGEHTTMKSTRLVIQTAVISSLLFTTACNQNDSSELSYVAMGEEPDWNIEVKSDNTLIYSSPNIDKDIVIKANREAYSKGVQYTGEHNSKVFSLNLNGSQPCESSMNNKTYDMSANLSINGQTMKGCATSK